MAENIASKSREEALSEIVPEVKQKQGRKKLSHAFKPSLKNKASAKNKPSAKLKALKKGAKKNAEQRATASEAAEEKATEAPPLPPPAESPQDPNLMEEAVVISEAAGKLYFAKQGKLTLLSEQGFYTMVTGSGMYSKPYV